ncbi:MAG: hypothetical protein KatS3mg096_340 [Candidatus Parcubacteria bacterium]|nr:MAG: hypothetical protein KatS3mg096_340 [Candidatus Parcubacteria bacterium]
MNKKILLFTLVLGGLLLSFFFLSFFKSTSAQVCLPLNGYLVWPGTWESGRIPMASTQQYTLSSSPFYVSGNNVGLGTTNPVYTFQVNGDISGTRLCIGSDCRNVWPGGGIAGSGSAGQVAFWTGTSNISGDNALFWDNINKRLGIGTISPQTSLHVAGNITANTFLGTINAANISSGQFGANTGGGNYYFMGNVGIGMTTPTAKLHVNTNDTTIVPFQVDFLTNLLLYRKPITISNSGSNLTDYQLLVTMNTASLISAGKMRSDCGDIRFTDSDGSTFIGYWIESGCNSASTKIWVRVPLIPVGTKTIYVYYGNPEAASQSKIWYNVKHLNIYGGVFNYKASLGINGYHSREMQHRLGVSAGVARTCILKSNGTVDCFGDNQYGQSEDYLGGDAIGVSAGSLHTCVLKSNGNVDCYGNNDYGQSEDYLGGDAIGVSAGLYHTCILKSNGNVDCYGTNYYGQSNDYLGGDAIGVSAGLYHTCILKSNGNVDCYGDNLFGKSNDYLGGDAIGVSVGMHHTCVLKSNGNVDCYGDNSDGQSEDYLGGDAIGVSAGSSHTCVLKSNGNVDCYGNNGYGQSEDYLGGDAIGVSAGGAHTCILKSNGNVDCYTQASDYLGGDAMNPFRKYVFPTPTTNIGAEERVQQQQPKTVFYIQNQTGNIGIGTTEPEYKLDVFGNIRTTGCLVYNGGTLGSCISDVVLKTNIQDLNFENALNKILSLQPKIFEFKNEPGRIYHGLIAQDVENVAPELVTVDEKGYKQVKYGDIQWLLLEAIKEQQEIMEKQQKEIEELKQQVSGIRD